MWLVLGPVIAYLIPKVLCVAVFLLGFEFFEFLGTEFFQAEIEAEIAYLTGTLGTSMYNVLGLGGFWQAVNMIISAWTTRITFTIASGALRTFSWNPTW